MRPARKDRRALGIICAAITLQWRAAPVASALTLALMVGTGSSAAVAGWLSSRALDRGSTGDRSPMTLELSLRRRIWGKSAPAMARQPAFDLRHRIAAHAEGLLAARERLVAEPARALAIAAGVPQGACEGELDHRP